VDSDLEPSVCKCCDIFGFCEDRSWLGCRNKVNVLALGNQFLSKNGAEIQLLTNHLCKHCFVCIAADNYTDGLENGCPTNF
jgi:hypothetical protein